MDISYETVSILLLLLPGFLSSAILGLVTVRKNLEGLQIIIEALIFSFLIYVLMAFVYNDLPVRVLTTTKDETTSYQLQLDPKSLGTLGLLAILIPLALGWLATHDLHMKFLRYLRVTNKSARATIWLDVFFEQNRYIIVNLTDGRRISGWPMYYSDEAEERLLYLKDPAWVIDKKGGPTYLEMGIHGIFLVRKENIDSIEFTNTTLENVQQNMREQDDNRR